MYIQENTRKSMKSIEDLFWHIAEHPWSTGNSVVAVGRPQPADKDQVAHVAIAYWSDNRWNEDGCHYVVHDVYVEDGQLKFVHGDYDLTLEEALLHPRIKNG